MNKILEEFKELLKQLEKEDLKTEAAKLWCAQFGHIPEYNEDCKGDYFDCSMCDARADITYEDGLITNEKWRYEL